MLQNTNNFLRKSRRTIEYRVALKSIVSEFLGETAKRFAMYVVDDYVQIHLVVFDKKMRYFLRQIRTMKNLHHGKRNSETTLANTFTNQI